MEEIENKFEEMSTGAYYLVTLALHMGTSMGAILIKNPSFVFQASSIVTASTLYFFLPAFLISKASNKATSFQKLENSQMNQLAKFFVFLGILS